MLTSVSRHRRSRLNRFIRGANTNVLLLVVLIALIAFGLISREKQVPFAVISSFTTSVPFTTVVQRTSQEAYTTQVLYTFLELQTKVITYHETVAVTRTVTASRDSIDYKTYDYNSRYFDLRERRWVDGSWKASDTLLLVLIGSKETVDSLTKALFDAGLGAIITIGGSGSVSAGLIALAATSVPVIIRTVASSNDYYAINQQSGSFSKNWEPGTYYALIINLSGKAGRFEVQVTYTYSQAETVTRSRTETSYRQMTVYSWQTSHRTVTRYVDEIRYSIVTTESEETQQRTEDEYPLYFLINVAIVGFVALVGWNLLSSRRPHASKNVKSRRSQRSVR